MICLYITTYAPGYSKKKKKKVPKTMLFDSLLGSTQHIKHSLAYVKIINKGENSCFLYITIYTTLVL